MFIEERNMHRMHLMGQECCISCGKGHRWNGVWKKGWDSEEYANWSETGLCPRCYDPKDSSDQIILTVCCRCSVVTDIRWANKAKYMESIEMSHGYCESCADIVMKELGL